MVKTAATRGPLKEVWFRIAIKMAISIRMPLFTKAEPMFPTII